MLSFQSTVARKRGSIIHCPMKVLFFWGGGGGGSIGGEGRAAVFFMEFFNSTFNATCAMISNSCIMNI